MTSPPPRAPHPVDLLPPEEPRRGFLRKAIAVVIGGVVGLFPLVTGTVVFLDPLWKRKPRGTSGKDDEGFLKVAQLDALPVGGAPRRFTVIDDRTDAWNLYPQEPVGAVFLTRPEAENVRACNVQCPHAGCFVDYIDDRKLYQCPCHDSSFNVDGTIANPRSPSPRGLDELEVKVVKVGGVDEVWVKFQNFRSGVSEKIAEA